MRAQPPIWSNPIAFLSVLNLHALQPCLAQAAATARPGPDTDFRIAMDGGRPVPLPTDEFSVRQVNALRHAGKYYLYGDIIRWSNPKHPDSYGSSIGVFSSTDGRGWDYHGEVVSAGDEGQWDYGGVATPGVCELRGRFYVAYSGRQKRNGLGRRLLGLAAADGPLGPFHKAGAPIFPLEGHPQDDPCFDDPCLITRPGDDRMWLYYRHARWRNRTREAYDYTIRLRTSIDSGRTWSEPTVVLRPGKSGVLETIEAKWIEGQFVLFVLDYAEGAKAALYVSRDGLHFERCRQRHVEDGEGMRFTMGTVCTRLPGLIPDEGGQCRLMNAAGVTDAAGHFTQWIYRVRCE